MDEAICQSPFPEKVRADSRTEAALIGGVYGLLCGAMMVPVLWLGYVFLRSPYLGHVLGELAAPLFLIGAMGIGCLVRAVVGLVVHALDRVVDQGLFGLIVAVIIGALAPTALLVCEKLANGGPIPEEPLYIEKRTTGRGIPDSWMLGLKNFGNKWNAKAQSEPAVTILIESLMGSIAGVCVGPWLGLGGKTIGRRRYRRWPDD